MISRAILSMLAPAMLLGCGSGYVVEELRSRYQEVELPAVFANGDARFRFSGHAALNSREEITFGRESGYSTGGDMGFPSTFHPVHGDYRIRRDQASFGGAMVYMAGGPFGGVALGTSAPHADQWHMGILSGWTGRLGPVTPMFSAGTFFNRVVSDATYFNEVGVEESGEESLADLSWPIKAGLMAHAGPFSPYVVVGRDGTSFWPYLLQDDKGYTIESMELSLGCRIQANEEWSIFLEAGRERSGIDSSWDGEHWTGRLRVELDRF